MQERQSLDHRTAHQSCTSENRNDSLEADKHYAPIKRLGFKIMLAKKKGRRERLSTQYEGRSITQILGSQFEKKSE